MFNNEFQYELHQLVKMISFSRYAGHFDLVGPDLRHHVTTSHDVG